MSRKIQAPAKFPEPVLDSKTFSVFQPYLAVLPDGNSGGYRAWFHQNNVLCHAESADGVHWHSVKQVWDLKRAYGPSIVDDGPRGQDKERRFKSAFWSATRELEGRLGDDSGVWVGFSPDGLRWKPYSQNPVLMQFPDGPGKWVPHSVSDIIDVFYDPHRRLYGMAVKLVAQPEDGYAAAPLAGDYYRRLVGMSTSKDFIHWSKPYRILVPDDQDEGTLEFYGMGGIHLRGGLYIGFARILRDDLPATPGGPINGIGYSVLVTSRDGVTWKRDREAFLYRNLEPGAWDHAMAWVSTVLPVGDELFIYYGGYARGHKIEPRTERQIGLARIKRDRYVAFATTREEGAIYTRPFVVSGDSMTVNVDASRGELLVRLLDENGKPLASWSRPEAEAIRGDQLVAPVRWEKSIGELRGRVVRLEFRLRDAALYGFEFHATSPERNSDQIGTDMQSEIERNYGVRPQR